MNNRFIRFFIIALDLLSLNVVFLTLQYFLRLDNISGSYSLKYTFFLILLNAAWMVVTWVTNLYYEKFLISFETFSRRTVRAYFYWLVIVLMYLFFSHQYELSRLFTGIVLLGFGCMLLLNRVVYLFIRSYLRKHKVYTRKILIIGYNNIKFSITKANSSRIVFKYFFELSWCSQCLLLLAGCLLPESKGK